MIKTVFGHWALKITRRQSTVADLKPIAFEMPDYSFCLQPLKQIENHFIIEMPQELPRKASLICILPFSYEQVSFGVNR